MADKNNIQVEDQTRRSSAWTFCPVHGISQVKRWIRMKTTSLAGGPSKESRKALKTHMTPS